jgi:Na+/citrate or Na+/malate symporter
VRSQREKQNQTWATRHFASKFALRFGFLGLGIAAVLFVLALLNVGKSSPQADCLWFALWPASLWFMAFDNAPKGTVLLITVLAFIANFLLYFIAGLIIACILKIAKRILSRQKSVQA